MVLRLKTWESRSLPGLLKAMPHHSGNNLLTTKTKAPGQNQRVAQSDPSSFKGTLQNERNAKDGSPLYSRCPPYRRQNLRFCSGRKHHSKAVTLPRHSEKPNALGAGWSSPVARQAHNLKAAGSNPAPATKTFKSRLKTVRHIARQLFKKPHHGAFLRFGEGHPRYRIIQPPEITRQRKPAFPTPSGTTDRLPRRGRRRRRGRHGREAGGGEGGR